MWILYAFASAIFAGLCTIFAKLGMKTIDSQLATALRTCVVFVFAWIMAILTSSLQELTMVSSKTYGYLILSGLCTGASWLCYFCALKKGNINKVAAIDKTSIILTIVLSWILFQEQVLLPQMIGMIGIGCGTMLMLEKKETSSNGTHYVGYAIASVIFASLTTILGKIGIEYVDSNLGTAIRTSVVLVMAWMMVLVTNKHRTKVKLNKKELFCILCSGLCTGISWLCFYHALQMGSASIVIAIDKLSIVVTFLISTILFHEKETKQTILGMILLVIGTLCMIIK